MPPLDDSDKKWVKEMLEKSMKTKDGKFTLDHVVVGIQELNKRAKSRFDEYDKRFATPPKGSRKIVLGRRRKISTWRR